MDSWSALLRMVAVTDGSGTVVLTPDPQHRLPGRGAWLHPTERCFDLAVTKRAFTRALRVSAPVSTAALVAHLEAVRNQPSEAKNRKRV